MNIGPRVGFGGAGEGLDLAALTAAIHDTTEIQKAAAQEVADAEIQILKDTLAKRVALEARVATQLKEMNFKMTSEEAEASIKNFSEAAEARKKAEADQIRQRMKAVGKNESEIASAVEKVNTK